MGINLIIFICYLEWPWRFGKFVEIYRSILIFISNLVFREQATTKPINIWYSEGRSCQDLL